MGPSTLFGSKTLWLLLLLQIFKLCSATVTFDSESTKAFKDVSAGTKHYALFKVSKDFTTVSFVKVSDGDFNDLTKDLLASKEALLAAYSASVTDETGQKSQELVVLAWQPSGLTDELGEKYSTLIDETEDVLDVDIWLAVVTDSGSDFNLEVLLESASEGYNRIISSHVEYGVTEVSVTVVVDVNLKASLSDVSLGTKRYIILKFSDDFSTVLLDKVAGPSASFSDLAADLKAYEASGQVRIVLYYLPVVEDGLVENRLLMILWTPSTADKTLVTKYLSKLKSLKASLKIPIWTDVTLESTNELSVEGINGLLPAFIGRLQKPVVETTVTPEKLETGKEVTPELELDVDDDDDDSDDDDDDEDVPAKLDVNVEKAVDEVSKGLRRYLLLKWGPANNLVVDKSAGPGATFEQLVADLTTVQKSGEGRYVLYYDSDKKQLILIVWTPSNLPKAQVQLYRKGFKKLKRLLKKTYLVVVSRSPADLNLQLLFKRGILFDFDVWFKRRGGKHGKGKGHHGKKLKGHLKNFLRGKHVQKEGGRKGKHGEHGWRFGKKHEGGHGFGGKHKGGHGGKHGGGFGVEVHGDLGGYGGVGGKGGYGGVGGKGGYGGVGGKGGYGGVGGKGGYGGVGGKGGYGGVGGKGGHEHGGKGGLGYGGKHEGGLGYGGKHEGGYGGVGGKGGHGYGGKHEGSHDGFQGKGGYGLKGGHGDKQGKHGFKGRH